MSQKPSGRYCFFLKKSGKKLPATAEVTRRVTRPGLIPWARVNIIGEEKFLKMDSKKVIITFNESNLKID